MKTLSKLFILNIILFAFNSCNTHKRISGKWLASFQESYSIYNFKQKTCIKIYTNPKGNVFKTKYNYNYKSDTLYLYKINTDSIYKKYKVIFQKDNVIIFNDIILQRYKSYKRVKPIVNKPNF